MPTELTYDPERDHKRPKISFRYMGRELPVDLVELKGTTALNQYISDSMRNILNLPVHDEVSVSKPEVEGMLRAREVAESPLTEERLSEILSGCSSGRTGSSKPNMANPPRSYDNDNEAAAAETITDLERYPEHFDFLRRYIESQPGVEESLRAINFEPSPSSPPSPKTPEVWLVMPSDVRESARLTPIGAEPALGGWSSYYEED